MNRYGAIIAVMLALTACSSAEERAKKRAQAEIEACEARGLEAGTAAFDTCRLQIRAAEQKRKEERMWWDDNAGMPGSSYRVHSW